MTPRQQKLHDENIHARFLEPTSEENLEHVPKLEKLEGGEDGPSDRKPLATNEDATCTLGSMHYTAANCSL